MTHNKTDPTIFGYSFLIRCGDAESSVPTHTALHSATRTNLAPVLASMKVSLSSNWTRSPEFNS
jgi:hypothetical protein